MVTEFERMLARRQKDDIRCGMCGGVMLPCEGKGLVSDRFICKDSKCGGEIIFETSTVQSKGKAEDNEELRF